MDEAGDFLEEVFGLVKYLQHKPSIRQRKRQNLHVGVVG